jgi:uncharacterized protein (DUF885 family)
LPDSLQYEFQAPHVFRRCTFVTAYNEGSAVYAATLAREIGVYGEPEECYGRIELDGNFTSRFTVDTGINVLGWSHERARDCTCKHNGVSDAGVLAQRVRHSCDLPVVPNSINVMPEDHFVTRRSVQYFVDHLARAQTSHQ